MQAQQIINVDEGHVELRNAELPDPGSGQILVRTRVSAISPGTERAFCLGLLNTPRVWPRSTGYSLVGEIVAAGAGVDLAAGQRVHVQEGHASAVLTEATKATPVPDAARDEHAAFLAMLIIALQGVRKARVEIGETVLVIGGGLIGQLAAQWAHMAGAGEVLLADISQFRLGIAVECGFAEPMNPTIEADRRNIARAGPSGGPEVVIEATGAPEPINDAFRYAGHGGRVVLLGSTRGDTEQVNFYRDVHKKGLTILGAHNAIRPEVDDSPARWTARRDRLAAMRALATRRLNLDPLITHRFAALEHDKAYRLLFDWDDGFLGCVLHWPKGDVPTPEA